MRRPVLTMVAAARAPADQVKGGGNGGGKRFFDPELAIRDSTGPCSPGPW